MAGVVAEIRIALLGSGFGSGQDPTSPSLADDEVGTMKREGPRLAWDQPICADRTQVELVRRLLTAGINVLQERAERRYAS